MFAASNLLIYLMVASIKNARKRSGRWRAGENEIG